MNFSKRIVVISGGNSGIGAACVKAFAEQGATVIILARREVESRLLIDEVNGQHGIADFIKTDISVPKQIRSAIQEIANRYGRLDIAINNAGVTGQTGVPLTNYPEDEFRRVMDINVTATYIAMQQQLRIMQKQQQGVIINISSLAGIKAGAAGFAYTTSKHAVVGMTRSVAKEVAEENIRINAICPAFIETPMLQGPNFDEEKLTSIIPVKRLGKAEEVAQAAVWLCSDAAAYVTGIALPIDGGISA